MSAPTTIYLLRHAQSEPDRTQPEHGWPLSARGAEQARRLVAALAHLPLDRFVSSPYRRAIDTIAPIAGARGASIAIEADLRERTLTTGHAENWDAMLRASWADFALAHPGGESGLACQARVASCLARLAARHAGERLLVASHGNAIALFLNAIDGSVGYAEWRAMRNPDLFRIEWKPSAFSWDRAFAVPLAR